MPFQDTQRTSIGSTKILPLQASYLFYQTLHNHLKKETRSRGMALLFEKLPPTIQVALKNEEIPDWDDYYDIA